ncbi:MAG: hypothetical protein ACKO1M_07360 [Planctomycetota bacterium]
MNASRITIVAAVVSAFAAGATGRAEGLETVLLGHGGWEEFAGGSAGGSFAWAGEDETLINVATSLGAPLLAGDFDTDAIDVAFLTAIPAPEPPALVLAGMAFGGLLCGRSLLMSRRARSESAAVPEDGHG